MLNSKIPTDFNDLHNLEGLDAVTRIINAAKPVSSVLSVPDSEVQENREWAEPVALPDILPPVKHFESSMLPVTFQKWVWESSLEHPLEQSDWSN